MKENESILENKRIHDKIYKKYEKNHGEIFNEIEQQRLFGELKNLKSLIKTRNKEKVALDLGCGSGNLTKHLLKLGYNVIASDVSKNFLKLVKKRFNSDKLSVKKINGTDLDTFEDNSVDLIVIYSVLHHIPDYLTVIKECVRVLKKGGILYMDHEPNEKYWKGDKTYLEFKKKIKNSIPLKVYINPSTYIKYFYYKFRLFSNPRYQPEGDIHVFPDDHVEGTLIKDILKNNNMEVLAEKNYLLYRREYDFKVYKRYNNETSDSELIIARKK